MNPLLLIGAGAALIGLLVFWSAIQNWLSDLVHRASAQLGELTHALQSALVVFDRVIVGGQRLVAATLKVFYRDRVTQDSVTVDEVRQYTPDQLPAEIRARLDSGQPLQYELSVNGMQVKRDPTYRLVVRGAE
jgi:hypothetical protein